MLDHQDKFMMKAQVHVSKSSAISDEQALPQRKHPRAEGIYPGTLPLDRVEVLSMIEKRSKVRDFVKVKTINGDVQIRALVDGKKIIVNEASIRPKEIADLKKRVKRLERKKKSRSHGLKRLYKVGLSTRVESFKKKDCLGDQEDASKQRRSIADIKQDAKTTLVDDTQGRINEEEMFDVNDLDDDEVIMDTTSGEEVEQGEIIAKKEVSTANPITTTSKVVTIVEGVEVTTAATTPQIPIDELTTAKALIDIKTSKPKPKRIVIKEPSETPTPTPVISSQQPSHDKDKGKAIMVEPKKPLKKKDQIAFDEEVARKLEAQMQVELKEERKKG
nr:hypothetical protein [Tanacetum cinerariifolium]